MVARPIARLLLPLLSAVVGGAIGCGASSSAEPDPVVPAPDASAQTEAGVVDGGASDTETADAAKGGQLGPCPAAQEGLISLDEAPLGLVTDETHVYWISSRLEGAGAVQEVRRAPLGGGTVETLRTTTRDPATLTKGNGKIYWIEGATGAANAELYAWDAPGGAKPIAVFAAALGTPDTFVLGIDPDNAYVLFQQFGGSGFGYVLRAVPLNGGATAIVTKNTLPFGSRARDLVVGGPDVFWGFTGGILLRADKTARNATPSTILNDASGLDAWTVRTDDVVFGQNGVMRRVPRTGGSPSDEFPGSDVYRTVLAVGDMLIWSTRDQAGAEQLRARRRDGSICVIATEDVKSVFALTATNDTAFFANTATKAAGGAVRWARLPK
jgi:hypothetical protein